MVKSGPFQRIYNPSLGDREQWYINDHCFIQGEDGTWHLIGITHAEPQNPQDETNLAHATASDLLQPQWEKQPFALSADRNEWGENHLWAPHVVENNGLYYMFYCAGDDDDERYKIHLATSSDLWSWTRHPENPVVVGGYHARDPFVLKIGDEWVMYYTATSAPSGGNHIVAYQKSADLIHWDSYGVAFTDPSVGTFNGPTESPFVVRRGDTYYLFIGPRGGYVGTEVLSSRNPFQWELKNSVGHIASHAAEVVRDSNGKWYISHCGWAQGGVYLAELFWEDGLEGRDTSIPRSW